MAEPDDPQEAVQNRSDLRFEARQRALHEHLLDRRPDLATLYESALRSLSEDKDEKGFFMAGHAVRLLMSDFPTAFALESFGSLPDLSAKVQELGNMYRAAQQSECCTNDGWCGVVDNPLAKLLDHMQGFFLWWGEPRKQNLARDMFQRSDPAAVPLPDEAYGQKVNTWITLHRYFSQVAHGRRTNGPEFRENLARFETLALQSLEPRPSESFAAIDALLNEEVSDA